ncbi:MAG TPA: tRNA (guanine(46)-N(7))-methyltransferase TrmB [Hyphomicrobiaceae bacterium]|jgi:tRNA (guanine-N7-)-methyltransferase|nr:tRNA (guanine(46)-N(7))-methyltransferase TrmB [Hyphomicrobiaceae bacterium]
MSKVKMDIDRQVQPDAAELRSFGRRRGRKLSARQEMLLRQGQARATFDLGHEPPADIAALFPTAVDEVWLEIGFGGGEHLLWQAARNPRTGIIGCEPFRDGVVKVLDAIETTRSPNILVHPDDARPLLRWLPPASVGRTFILFPDPWPKARHRKRRLINIQLLDLLARVMPAGAELRVATDIGDYARGILAAVYRQRSFQWLAKGPRQWRERPEDWPETRYERKAIAAGRRCYYLAFCRQ